jgi:hypothetical protein
MKKCKMAGCERKYECKGFCMLHYHRWKAGIIDIDGNVLRDLYSDHPFNRALRSTLRLVRQAGSNAEEIQHEIKDGDRFLKKDLNKRLLDINRDTAGQEPRLVEKDFVFGNIHLLQPRTVQMVLMRRPVARRRTLALEDKARIAWHLLRRGISSEKVAEMFPAYSLKQVQAVAQQLRDGTLPVPPDVLKGRRL